MKLNNLMKKTVICLLSSLISICSMDMLSNIYASESTDRNIASTLELTPESAFSVATSSKGGYIYGYDVSIGGTDVVIPDVIKGIEIKRITSTAFNNKGMTSVVFPEGLEELGDNAFTNNPLTHFELPSTLKTIGRDAFSGASNKGGHLGELVIPDSVTSIGIAAFANAGVTSLKISNGLTKIEATTFYANELIEVNIPEGITEIAAKAFQSNLSLKKVVLPNSLTSIGDNAFQLCKINDLMIGNAVTTIGPRAFSNNSIVDLQLPTTLTTIGYEAFSSNSIRELVIPDSVTSLGTSAFSVNYIESLSIGSGISVIPANCFNNNRLSELNIPSTITTIDDQAFAVNQLVSLSLPDTVTNLATYGIGLQKVSTYLTKKDGKLIKRMNSVSEQLDLDKMVNVNVTWGTYDPVTKEVTYTGAQKNGMDIISYYYHIENSHLTSDTAMQVRLLFNANYDYQVRFVDHDNTVLDTQYIKHGESAVEPALPTPPSHKVFAGWNKEFSSVTDEMIITAMYENAKYTIDYKESNGDLIDSVEVEYDSLISEPTHPSKPGYTFKGWYTDTGFINAWDFSTDLVSGNMTLYAKWEAIQYTVSIQEDQRKILRVQKDGINQVNDTNSFAPTVKMQAKGLDMITDYSLLEWEVENIAGFESYDSVVKIDETTGKIIGLKSGVAKVTVKLKVGYDPLDTATYDSVIIIVPGNINKTGTLMMYDATVIMRSLTQSIPVRDLVGCSNKEYLDELSDMDGDGVMTAYDATIIGRMISQNERPSN